MSINDSGYFFINMFLHELICDDQLVKFYIISCYSVYISEHFLIFLHFFLYLSQSVQY